MLNRGRSSSRCGILAVHLGLGAITGDVTGLTAAIAGLARSVEWAAIRSRAVARDMSLKRVSAMCIVPDLDLHIPNLPQA